MPNPKLYAVPSRAGNQGPVLTHLLVSLALLLSHATLAVVLRRIFLGREQGLYELAHRDPLTTLSNRRALDRDLARCVRDQAGVALLGLLDVDGLKGVNDTLGHPAGDDLLRRLALGLAHTVGERGQVYRLSGDEFAVMLEGGDPEGLERMVEAALRRVQAVYREAGLSVGTARQWPGESPGDWLSRADQAMYRCKRRRRKTRRKYRS